MKAVSSSIKRYEVVPSTNTVLLDLARDGAPAWTVVVADRQTEGRGRLQRAWVSPADAGLYFSVLLKPSLPIGELPRMTLAGGVAVCQALESCGVPTPLLKWPNDILLVGRKTGGILTETGSLNNSAASPPAVVVGIGLNISTPLSAFPPAVRVKATSIALATGLDIDRETLLGKVLTLLGAKVDLLERGDFATLLEEWRHRDGIRGQTLTWVTTAGKKVRGTGLGIDENGLYHIRDNRGTVHEILSGDLNLI